MLEPMPVMVVNNTLLFLDGTVLTYSWSSVRCVLTSSTTLPTFCVEPVNVEVRFSGMDTAIVPYIRDVRQSRKQHLCENMAYESTTIKNIFIC